jgi:hypothetical protein
VAFGFPGQHCRDAELIPHQRNEPAGNVGFTLGKTRSGMPVRFQQSKTGLRRNDGAATTPFVQPGFHLPFNFHLISTPWKPAAIAGLIEAYERALPPGGWA